MIKDKNGNELSYICDPNGKGIAEIKDPAGNVIHIDCIYNSKYEITIKSLTENMIQVDWSLSGGEPLPNDSDYHIVIYAMENEEQVSAYPEVYVTATGDKPGVAYFLQLTPNSWYSVRIWVVNPDTEEHIECVGRETIYVANPGGGES